MTSKRQVNDLVFGGKAVDVQNPLRVDGVSVLVSDIDFDNSDFTDWGGNPEDVFSSPFSGSITNSTANNPKSITIAFNRTVKALQIGLGENNGGDFSNVKISLLGSGGAERSIYDQSADSTKKTSCNAEFKRELFNSLKIEFYTSDTVSLSNVTIQKAKYITAQIEGVDSSGNLMVVGVSQDGFLEIIDRSSGLSISAGIVSGLSYVHKFGQAPDFDESDNEVTIWDGANDGGLNAMVYTWSTTTAIDSISSSDAGDTQEVKIQGLDNNLELVEQIVTLNGQTRVALSTPLIRTFRAKNNGQNDFVGDVYVYENTAITGGTPDDSSKVRLLINNGNNQTLMALYTVASNKIGYMRDWYASTAGASKDSNYIIRLWAREYNGSGWNAWQLKHVSSISDKASSYMQHKYSEPQKFAGGTDIMMTVEATAGGLSGAAISAGFDIVLENN